MANFNPIITVIIILMIGFLVTVPYPLHFLPLDKNQIPSIKFGFNIIEHIITIRGILLILLTFVIEGILSFLHMNWGLKQKYFNILMDMKDSHMTLSDYSPYFK